MAHDNEIQKLQHVAEQLQETSRNILQKIEEARLYNAEHHQRKMFLKQLEQQEKTVKEQREQEFLQTLQEYSDSVQGHNTFLQQYINILQQQQPQPGNENHRSLHTVQTHSGLRN
jgi:lysyl-tRNA synthetase class I